MKQTNSKARTTFANVLTIVWVILLCVIIGGFFATCA